MAKIYVVTGVGSGIGRATAELLRGRGHRVIGVDLRDAEVIADLADDEGRARMIEEVTRAAPDGLDGFVAAAGVSPDQGAAAAILRINYFGAVMTALGLRPLLARRGAARGVMIASTSILMEPDPEWVEVLLANDEATALATLSDDPSRAYMASKLAVTWWTRREAVSDAWAGAGIALNCVAPGVVDTPMNASLFTRPEDREMLSNAQPNALGRFGRADELASAIGYLVDECPPYLLGQVLYVDGGIDAILRPKVY